MGREVGKRHYLYHHIRCQNCGQFFDSSRADSKTCSAKCRTALKRQIDKEAQRWTSLYDAETLLFGMLKSGVSSLTEVQIEDLRALESWCKGLRQMVEDHGSVKPSTAEEKYEATDRRLRRHRYELRRIGKIID